MFNYGLDLFTKHTEGGGISIVESCYYWLNQFSQWSQNILQSGRPMGKPSLSSFSGKVSTFQVLLSVQSFPSVWRLWWWKLKNHNVRKCTLAHVHPALIQISLCIRAVCSESLLGAFCITKVAKFLHAVNEDWSDCADAQADWSLHGYENFSCKSSKAFKQM